MPDRREHPEPGRLHEVTRLALRLGFTAFGGPLAHIALLRADVVERRRWLSDREFLDLLAVTNLIPGPNSTEMVMHIGRLRAGRRGLVAAGTAFILPAALITLLFAVLYDRYGATVEAGRFLDGVKPIVIVVVAQALWSFARSAIRSAPAALLAAIVVALSLLGVGELVLLLGGGLLVLVVRRRAQLRRAGSATLLSLFPFGAAQGLVAFAGVAEATVPYSALRLFLTFLKIGSVLYGSGYVLLAFLQGDFVDRYGWLTERQLLDAVAVGQFTPGPVFTTATFVGYLAGGGWGAVLATIGIFLPAFVFVGLTHIVIERVRQSPAALALLEGVTLASLGLMAAVTLALGRDAFDNAFSVPIALVAAILLLRLKVNAAWLIIGGGAASAIVQAVS